MGKVLGWVLVALIVWVVWTLWKASQRRRDARGASASVKGGAASDPSTDASPGVERMVRCAHCDLHLPASQARFASGKAYCSEEHQRLSAS
jgi:uncharacterized protein